MSTLRQQVLILHLANSDLASPTVAWALYDGAGPAGTRQMQTGDSSERRYVTGNDTSDVSFEGALTRMAR